MSSIQYEADLRQKQIEAKIKLVRGREAKADRDCEAQQLELKELIQEYTRYRSSLSETQKEIKELNLEKAYTETKIEDLRETIKESNVSAQQEKEAWARQKLTDSDKLRDRSNNLDEKKDELLKVKSDTNATIKALDDKFKILDERKINIQNQLEALKAQQAVNSEKSSELEGLTSKIASSKASLSRLKSDIERKEIGQEEIIAKLNDREAKLNSKDSRLKSWERELELEELSLKAMRVRLTKENDRIENLIEVHRKD